ncbi:hypothetical protein BH18ACT4_BH18ACT4_10620 [soil metagenome]
MNAFVAAYIELRRQARVDEDVATANVVQVEIDKVLGQRAELLAPLDQLDEALAQVAVDDTRARGQLADQRRSEADRIAGELSALDNQLASLRSTLTDLEVASQLVEGSPRVVTQAVVPTAPFSPTPGRNALLGLVVGLILGLGLALLTEYLDDSIKSKDEVETVSGLTALALIPRVTGWKDTDEEYVVSVEEPTSVAAEAYRSLRTSLQFLALDRPMRSIMITSPQGGEGKSTTVANLAIALARAGQRVAIVSCDLRRPRLHSFFGLSNDIGFTSVILNRVPPRQAVQTVTHAVWLLASGPPPPNPSELLSSERAARILRAIAAQVDTLLIDSPPVLPVTDALILSARADAVLVVAGAHSTTHKAMRRAGEMLRQVGAPLIGTVLNSASAEDAYGYGYGYGYGYEERPPPRRPHLPRGHKRPSADTTPRPTYNEIRDLLTTTPTAGSGASYPPDTAPGRITNIDAADGSPTGQRSGTDNGIESITAESHGDHTGASAESVVMARGWSVPRHRQ